MSEQTELRERLHHLAEDSAPEARAGLADVIVARHRSRRREHLGLMAVAAGVAAVVVGASVVIDDGPSAAPAPLAVPASGTDEDAPVPDTATLPAADVYGGPTRGSLADDSAFVAAVQRLPWTDGANGGTGIPDAPQSSRHVVFAGEIGGVRVALVAGRNNARPTAPLDSPERQTDVGILSNTAVAWFVGPADGPADRMTLAGLPYGIEPSKPTALFGAGFSGLVVVAAPGDTTEVSLRPDVARDSTVHRSWQEVTATDGVVVLELDGERATSRSIRYRVTRAGSSFTHAPVTFDSGDAVETSIDPPGEVTWVRPAPPASPPDEMRTAAVEELLAWTALRRQDVDVTVLWAGDLPAPTNTRARVTVLAVTLPSGAIYLTAPLGAVLDDGAVGGTLCGSIFLPAGPSPADRTVAVRCDATDMSADSPTVSSLIVVGPRTAATARALDGDEHVIAEYPLEDGVAVVPLPDALALVETLAADGTVLDQVMAPISQAAFRD